MNQTDKKVLLLELGVGEMTPSIIKLPFWELTAKNENVFYACLNQEASHRPEHLRGRSLYLQGDLAEKHITSFFSTLPPPTHSFLPPIINSHTKNFFPNSPLHTIIFYPSSHLFSSK